MMQPGSGMSALGLQQHGQPQQGPSVQSPAGQQLPPQQQQQMQEQPKLDNISKVKALQWPLKEALANVMKVAAQNVYHNAAIDSGVKGSDQPPSPRFDKNLEEFYSICDQIELNLKVALECANLASYSQRYTPKLDMPNSTSTTDAHSYSHYISTVKVQVAHAKEIHDLLSNVARTDASLL